MKYLELFEKNKEPYWLVIITIDGIPEIMKLFKEKNSVDNYLINTIHDFLIKNGDKNYLEELNDPTDITELMDLASFSKEFDNYKIYVEYIDFSEKVEINPEILIKIDSKKYNI